MRLSRLLAYWFLPWLLAGCMATNPYAPVPKALYLTADTYGDVTRWGDLAKLYAFVLPEHAVPPPPGLDRIRVTHYTASGLKEIGPWRWRQTAVIDYVLTDRQVVRRLVDRQVWVSPDEGKHWYRENPPPDFLK